jgi:hypothetical protein
LVKNAPTSERVYAVSAKPRSITGRATVGIQIERLLREKQPQQFKIEVTVRGPIIGRQREPTKPPSRGVLGVDGLRAFAVAQSDVEDGASPEDATALGLRFVGLVGLVDPVRSSVPAAVAECGTAGIRVVMITGDYPTTAEAIARRAGIDAGRVVTGADLAQIDEASLRACVRTTCVFAPPLRREHAAGRICVGRGPRGLFRRSSL